MAGNCRWPALAGAAVSIAWDGWTVSGLAGLAFAVSAALVAAIIRHAQRLEIIDVPNERSSHVVPTPRGGGLAIVLVSLAAMAALAALPSRDPLALPVLVLLIVSAPVAIVSAIDDVRPLPAPVRLLVHLAVGLATWALAGGWNVVDLPVAGAVSLGVLAPLLSVVWVVGLLNAYNFMDGIDGLAALQAVIAGAAWAAVGWSAGSWPLVVLGEVVTAASLGFLVFNRPRARIFMGDVGSAFLGFLFAAIPMSVSHAEPRAALVGVAVVWPFVFDASFTFVRRALRGENVLAAHRSHLYQRLVIAGWSHGRATLLYGGLALYGAIAGVCYARHCAMANGSLAFGVPLLAAGLWLLTRHQERRADVPRG